MISKKNMCMVLVGLLASSALTANAAIFNGKATGTWVRGSVGMNSSATGYEKYGMVNEDDGVPDPSAEAPPVTHPTFNPAVTPDVTTDPTALFWWGDPFADYAPPNGTGKPSSPNKLTFDGVGSTGTLGQVNTGAGGALVKFADLWYTNGDTFVADGVASVDLDVSFFIQELDPGSQYFSLSGTLGITNTDNGSDPTGWVPDLVTLSGFSTTHYFNYDNQKYAFDVLGFSQDGGSSTTNFFLANEDTITYAALYARIAPVPEPSTILLFAVGVLGVAGVSAAKRRNR